MSSSSTPPPGQADESGAFAAWGLIAGVLLGGGLGFFLGYAVALSLCGGTVGWTAGALYERWRT